MRDRRLTNQLDRAAAATVLVLVAAATCLATLGLGEWPSPGPAALAILVTITAVSVSLSPITFQNEEVSVDVRELVVAATVVPLGGLAWALALGVGAALSRGPWLVRALRVPDARVVFEGWKALHALGASVVAASAALAVAQWHVEGGPVWRTFAIALAAAIVHGLTSSALVNATAAFVTHKQLPIFTGSALSGLVMTLVAGAVGAGLWATAAPTAPSLLVLSAIVVLVNALSITLRRAALSREEAALGRQAASLIRLDPDLPRDQRHAVVEDLTRAALECRDATVTSDGTTGPGEISASLEHDGLHLVAARPMGTRIFTRRDELLLRRLAAAAGAALTAQRPEPAEAVDQDQRRADRT